MFLRTSLGIAMRATGDNVQMIRALGINMIVFRLAISNGMMALAGALPAQYQGFANVATHIQRAWAITRSPGPSSCSLGNAAGEVLLEGLSKKARPFPAFFGNTVMPKSWSSPPEKSETTSGII